MGNSPPSIGRACSRVSTLENLSVDRYAGYTSVITVIPDALVAPGIAVGLKTRIAPGVAVEVSDAASPALISVYFKGRQVGHCDSW